MQCIKLTSCQIINCKDAYIRKLLRDEEAVCESSEYRSVRQLELIGQMFDRADAHLAVVGFGPKPILISTNLTVQFTVGSVILLPKTPSLGA